MKGSQCSPGQNLIDFYLDFNWKRKEISLGQPRTDSDLFLLKIQMKIKGNWSETESNWFLFKFEFKIKGNQSGADQDWFLFEF